MELVFNAAWRMSRAAVNVSFTSGVSETLENPTRGKRRRRRRRREERGERRKERELEKRERVEERHGGGREIE